MNYSKYSKLTKDKLTKYGGKCFVIRKGTNEVYNPITDEYESTKIVIEGVGLLGSFENNEINGSSVLGGDVKIMCTLNDKPKVADVIQFGKKNYTIVNISEVNPDGNCVIYYDIQAR